MNDEMLKLLEELCKKYGFTYDFLGKYIKIISNRDTWYIIDRDYDQSSYINLFHGNNHGNADMHKQKGTFKTLYNIFDYIYHHDYKYIKNKKLERVG